MAEKYWQSLSEYWKEFASDSQSALPNPSELGLDSPLPDVNKVVGRIHLPVDVYGWFASAIDKILHPKKHAPAPPEPKPGAFPAYALDLDLSQVLKAVERELSHRGYKTA